MIPLLLPLKKPHHYTNEQFIDMLPFPLLVIPQPIGIRIYTSCDEVPGDKHKCVPKLLNGKDIPNYFIYEDLAQYPPRLEGWLTFFGKPALPIVMKKITKPPPYVFMLHDFLLDAGIHYQARIASLRQMRMPANHILLEPIYCANKACLYLLLKLNAPNDLLCRPPGSLLKINNKVRRWNYATMQKPYLVSITQDMAPPQIK